MAAKTFFYGRISTRTQNDDRQREMADKLSIPDDCRFFETANGSVRNRKELNKLLDIMREDDTVYCESLSRISRDLSQMLEICGLFNARNVNLISLKEGEIDSSTPSGKLWLSLCGALSEWEKAQTAQRRKEGQEARRNSGKKCGGRKPISDSKMKLAVKLWLDNDMSIADIVSATGVNKSSLYRYLKDNGITRD